VQLQVHAGELVMLCGANGSGKTTLLRLLCGLVRRSRGDLRVFGYDPSTDPVAVRRHTTFVSHRGYLYDELTAFEMIRLWDQMLGRRRSPEALRDLLASVDLANVADEPVTGFSAGMRKRLTLLRLRLEEPRLILLDEPFAALDPPGQSLIENEVRQHQSRGAAVILASHAIERAARLRGRAIHLTQGQITWQGTTSELAERFRDADSLTISIGGATAPMESPR
jgi:heme ABC exporter ATP-binding subunit CcmA